MRRLLTSGFTFIILFLLALQIAGCGQVVQSTTPNTGGSNAANGALKIAVVPKSLGPDFWEQVHKGAVCAASKLPKVSVDWNGVTADTDVTGQINLLKNYLTQGVNGLVYAATDARALAQVSTQAINSKIPVVNFDSGTIPQPKAVPLFATDNVASAVKAADLLAQAMHSKGKVAFIPFQAGSNTNDQRAQGFLQGLKKYPDMQLVATQYSQSDANTAFTVTTDILTAHPDITGIFAANEPGVIGAAKAVQQAGKTGKIVIIGWDAAPDEVKGLQDGSISALVVQNPFKMGFDGLNAVVKMIRNGTQVQDEDTGVSFLTPANLNSAAMQAVLNPSCANPPA